MTKEAAAAYALKSLRAAALKYATARDNLAEQELVMAALAYTDALRALHP